MKYVMIGNSEYSILLKDYIEMSTVNKICAYCVEEEYILRKKIDGIPVISFEELIQEYTQTTTRLYFGIGYKKLGKIKKKLYEKSKKQGYLFENYIHPSAQIFKDTVVGEGNVVFENVIIQRNAQLGNGNLLFSNSCVMHDSVVGSFNTLCATSVINGFSEIGNCNFLGSNSTVKDHIKIGDSNLIGAAAYVKRNLDSSMTVLPSRSEVIGGTMKCIDKL